MPLRPAAARRASRGACERARPMPLRSRSTSSARPLETRPGSWCTRRGRPLAEIVDPIVDRPRAIRLEQPVPAARRSSRHLGACHGQPKCTTRARRNAPWFSGLGVGPGRSGAAVPHRSAAASSHRLAGRPARHVQRPRAETALQQALGLQELGPLSAGAGLEACEPEGGGAGYFPMRALMHSPTNRTAGPSVLNVVISSLPGRRAWPPELPWPASEARAYRHGRARPGRRSRTSAGPDRRGRGWTSR